MKTEFISKEDAQAQHKWYVIDAQNLVLGRLAVEIANRLRGKNKTNYSPHVDTGDYIIVVNADKIRLTGKKLTDKIYYRHTGYPGGIKSMTAKEMLARKPQRLLELAVKRMLPKNRLGDAMYRKLNVYAAPEHPHVAQQPEVLTFQPRYDN